MQYARRKTIYAITGFWGFMMAAALIVPGQTKKPITAQLIWQSAHTESSCELDAALTEFYLALTQDADTQGCIVIYSSDSTLPGLMRRHFLGMHKALTEEKQLASNRFLIVHGGKRSLFSTTFWVVPKGATPPAYVSVIKAEDAVSSPPGKFDEFIGYLSSLSLDVLLSYSDTELRLDGFARALQNNPNTIGYIVGYAHRQIEAEGYYETINGKEEVKSRRIRLTGKLLANRWKNNLTRRFGIAPSRIVTLDGGLNGCGVVQFWMLPKNAPVPKATTSICKGVKFFSPYQSH